MSDKLRMTQTGSVAYSLILQPLVREAVQRMDPKQRDELMVIMLEVKSILSDCNLPPVERMTAALGEFEKVNQFGPRWMVLCERLKDWHAEGGASLLLSCILDELFAAHASDGTARKAA